MNVYTDAPETTENTSEITDGSISTLNNRKNLTHPKTGNVCLPSTSKDLTSDSLRYFPKMPTETKKKKWKETGKSRIYTDSPEKLQLEQLRNCKENKRLSKEHS